MNQKFLDVLNYLEQDYVLNAGLIEALKLNEAELINFDSHGVAAMHKESGLMLSLNNDDALANYADLVGKKRHTLFYGCTNPDKITEIIPAVNHISPCLQMIYTLPYAPKVETDAELRLLDESYAQFVFENYSLKPQRIDPILYLIRRNLIYGAFFDGKMAGFVGRHEEGSMGLLEVLPEYKRRGLGRALEAFIIGVVLKEGRVPFGHVKTDNNVSRSLQSSIEGVKFADKLAVWFAIKSKTN